MHFIRQLQSAEQIASYKELLAQMSSLLDGCVEHLAELYRIVDLIGAEDIAPHHQSILVLIRHLMSALDGIAILASNGSGENCGPLLRSAFEAMIELLFILDDDTKRRALAYQVGVVIRQLKHLRRVDPDGQEGKQLRVSLKDDPLFHILNAPPDSYKAEILSKEAMLKKPEYALIEQEWRRIKKEKGREPRWYSLFGGADDFEKLAKKMKHGVFYEFIYRDWAGFSHAETGFESLGRGSDDKNYVKPIRHPEGVQTACKFASEMHMFALNAVLRHYFTAEVYSEFGLRCGMAEWQNRHRQMHSQERITAAWKAE
jgi:hypothetical protein